MDTLRKEILRAKLSVLLSYTSMFVQTIKCADDK